MMRFCGYKNDDSVCIISIHINKFDIIHMVFFVSSFLVVIYLDTHTHRERETFYEYWKRKFEKYSTRIHTEKHKRSFRIVNKKKTQKKRQDI